MRNYRIDYVNDRDLTEWLMGFFELVDDGRLNRGRSLYRSNKVISFEENKHDVFVEVQGSRDKPYHVSIDYDDLDDNGLPVIDHFGVDCTCPDAHICKHIVCAMINWAVRMEEQFNDTSAATGFDITAMEQALFQSNGKIKVKSETDSTLDKLRVLAQSRPKPIHQLEDASFWTFEPGLDEVMAMAHDAVRRSVKR